ncbi:hypothetical protein NDK47_08950 [Brevibacillus ruminantium]|uniref:Uncharacterized protein n=1 Tax=Brevibacillus ruminantium TaxID=2950604 RepID=A0ABY4WMU9_9BACL|nr:hypothetical protein [Brevibacillus ruminantium]USG67382.1 hypothetical protein NDK47_08950 [Brevibacillus ruminantium]
MEELQTKFSLKDEEIIKPKHNISYFDRDGYRYFLMYITKEGGTRGEYLLVIQAFFEPLTKEQIFAIFGDAPYADSKTYHQIIYKLEKYSFMFSNTDQKNRILYDYIMISPLNPMEE